MNNLRPERLDQFIGQERCVQIVKVLLASARKRKASIPHLLLVGPSGLGKTSISRIIASESGGRLIEVLGSALKSASELHHHLAGLKERDVLFIDEIHALNRKTEELLYPALEDGVIAKDGNEFGALMKSLGIAANDKPKTLHKLPSFTLIGATTILGMVSTPLRSRFAQTLQMEPYTLDDLDRIVANAASRLQFSLKSEMVREISMRSRGTARIAVNHLLWFRDFISSNGHKPSREAIKDAFALMQIDQHGLTQADRLYLRQLLKADGPVGLEMLATALGESVETVESSVEPFLIQQGLVRRTAKGRIAEPLAIEVLKEAPS